MSDTCKLEEAGTGRTLPCDGEACTFWRVVGHLGVAEEESGCAVQYFELLEGGDEIASWLLSVKNRIDGIGGPA